MNMKKTTSIELVMTCRRCRQKYSVDVDISEYSHYLNGALAADAFPNMDYKELKIIENNICSECYDETAINPDDCDYCTYKEQCDNSCIL